MGNVPFETGGAVVVPPVVPVVVPVVPVVVVPFDEFAGGIPSCCWRPSVRFASVWRVVDLFGWNLRTLFAIRRCATTVAICGAAQFGRGFDAPGADPVTTAASATTAASSARR